MATRAGGHAPVGSSDWILKEFSDISALCENELEDFTFSARNEVEWLNEHMSDILSSNNLNLAEIMKTPGKLRGKTPRTIRQRSPLKEIRQPLGEIASIDKRFNSPVRHGPLELPVKFHAQDQHNSLSQTLGLTQTTKDSGYHGESDSMEMERDLPGTQDLEMTEAQQLDATFDGHTHTVSEDDRLKDKRSTEGSFHSAKENQMLKDASGDVVMQESTSKATLPADPVSEQLRRESAEQLQDDMEMNGMTTIDAPEHDQEEETGAASSETSTPAKTVVRKSSLTFAALPARDPLTTKKSMGNRVSGHNAALGGLSYLGRITGGKSLGATLQPDDESNDEDEDEDEERADALTQDGTGAMARLHSKASTQRLHERISALSKTQLLRPTKSIPSNVSSAVADYPTLPDIGEPSKQLQANDEDVETSNLAGQSPSTASNQNAAEEKDRLPPFQIHQDEAETEKRPSTTPAGSPPKHIFQPHAPLVASKSKIQSLMQSARGLFSSSASASAQAKLEASSVAAPFKEKASLQYPSLSESTSSKPVPPSEPRRTRSSTEKEERRQREEQERQRPTAKRAFEVDSDRDELADVESADKKGQPSRKSPRRPAVEEQDELADQEHERLQSTMGPPAKPRSFLQKSTANRRPVAKPTKDQPMQQKVSIKIGSMTGRRPLTAATLSSISKGPDPSAQPKPTAGGKKESTASHSTTASSVPSFKSSTAASSAKPKALLAAERKKEADDKAAQKKLEQKRDLERRKAAQQEEAQKREQEKQAAERQREKQRQAEEERKRQEQRQAVEKKRADQQAKREQLQRDAEQQALLKSSAYRADVGPARPPSRQATLQDFPRPPSAQPQGPKRVWNPEQDDEAERTARPQATQNYRPAQDGKRRKTDDEETFDQAPKRPTMAPPVRLSNILKNGNKPMLGNYPRAPPPASHHLTATMPHGASQAQQFKQSYGSQGPQPPRPVTAMDIARFQNGAIPFANSSNAPASALANGTTAPYKTPLQAQRFGQAHPQHAQQSKSSPFVNGEYLQLDDIPSDSESEDSEEERERKANMPDWVLTPNLQQKLKDQEADNPDAVFGPVAPLHMEEMFKDKKGQARFRGRTSSANWFGADRLTEEEKARDLEARAKIRQDGGWTFGLGR